MIVQFLNWLSNQNLEQERVRIALAQQILLVFEQEDRLYEQTPPEYRNEERHIVFAQIVLLLSAFLQSL